MANTAQRVARADRPTRIRCFLDRATTRALHGWIQDMEDPTRRRTVNLYVGNELLDSFVACQFRQDLKDSGVGDGFYAFEYELPAGKLPEGTIIRLTDAETGTEFTGSPAKLARPGAEGTASAPGGTARTSIVAAAVESLAPAKTPAAPATPAASTPASALSPDGIQFRATTARREIVGAIFSADWHGVRGWAADMRHLGEKLPLKVFVDGRLCGAAVATEALESTTATAAKSRIGDGKYCFALAFPPEQPIADGMALRLEIDGAEIALPPEVGRIVSRVEGGIDRCDDRLVRGWAVDWNDPSRKLTVEIFVNQQLVGEAVAERPRDDVKRAGIGDGRFGFLFKHKAPLSLPLSQDVQVQAFVARTGCELAWSPWWVCRKVARAQPAQATQRAAH